MLTIHSGLRNNRYQRQPTGGFNQHFQLCSPKYRFAHKGPWECRPQFSRCIISISLSHHLVQITNTHDHELRPSAHPDYRQQPPHLLPGTEPTSTSRRLTGPDTDIFQLIASKTRSCSERHYLKLLPNHIPLKDISYTRNTSQRRSWP